jgi:hypothetical protein
MKDPEHTFFGLGDYLEQKKREQGAPYDNIFMSDNDGVEFKVNSFTCFQPNENLASSPVVCPSLLQWAGYLLTPAMETEEQKKERLHKLAQKPMKNYKMTHTTMKSQTRPTRENTADVATTPSKELEKSDTTGKSDTTIALQQPRNIAFLETVADMLTSPNDSAEKEEPTSVELLYRIGEALEAGKRTHNSISQKRKPVGFVDNEAKVKEGIASFVKLVNSMKEVDGQLDFPAAMDWLGRESKTGKSLIIDLTRPDDNESSSDDSSVNSKQSSDDSDYRDGSSDSKPPHKERISHNKEKNSDEGDCPPDGDDDLNISSSEEDISVDESNDSNNNYPDDLFNVLYGNREERRGVGENELYDKSQQDDKVEDDGDQTKSGGLGERQDFEEDDKVEDESVQDGIQHQDKSGGLEERQYDVVEDEGVQDGQQQLDTSGGLEDTDKEQQQDYRLDKTEKDTLSKSQRKRLRKKKRSTEKSDREQEEDQEGDHESYRKGEDSAEEVDKQKKKKKKRKKQSSDGI